MTMPNPTPIKSAVRYRGLPRKTAINPATTVPIASPTFFFIILPAIGNMAWPKPMISMVLMEKTSR